MGSPVRCAAALSVSLLTLFCGLPSVLGQDLRERDALCNEDGCFVIYFQRKTFLDSWRACKEQGGTLATVKRQEEADTIAELFSSADLRHSRTKVRVWIGLQRQPRQCTASRPLRGFTWTTGDQDTQYTNWLREDVLSTCSALRCVVMSYSTSSHEQHDNFKWLDGSCSVPVDGYLCQYTYSGMCPALQSEGGGNAFYNTPFNLLSSILTHLPFGSMATLPCPVGTKNEQSVLCTRMVDGTVGWSQDSPLCSDPPEPQNPCGEDNGGCEHLCREAGAHYYCKCFSGFQLQDDGQSCEVADVCQGAPCEFECLPLSDGYRCACPEGYMLAPDERGCVDVDECLQSPCEQLCVNAPGTFECRCRDGYRQDEEGECKDIEECRNGDPCEHSCENTPGSHICHCHHGYSPLPEDPSRCQDTDECQFPGICEQMCVNYDGGFECYCEVGYELRLSDHSSCRKLGEGEEPAVVTPSFPWATHHPPPEPEWDPQDPVYHWTPPQSNTDWPLEEDESLDWLTDPPTVLGSDVIWVTSAPQEEPTFHPALDTPTEEPEKEEVEEGDGGEDWWVPDWHVLGGKAQPDRASVPTTPAPVTTNPTTPLDWYDDYREEDEEETTTTPTMAPTSTISGGAWNWFLPSPDPTSQKPGPENTGPLEPITDQNTPVDYNSYSDIDVELEGVDLPAEVAPSQPPLSTLPPGAGVEGGNGGDPAPDSREENQGSSWLLVGLLVPLCIFVVVMVALGIVYCTRCAVQPRNKNATDCYHWISGAHDKQGAPNPSSGVKTHV